MGTKPVVLLQMMIRLNEWIVYKILSDLYAEHNWSSVVKTPKFCLEHDWFVCETRSILGFVWMLAVGLD